MGLTLRTQMLAAVILGIYSTTAGFRKGRGTRDQIANICWIIEKAREFQKRPGIEALGSESVES